MCRCWLSAFGAALAVKWSAPRVRTGDTGAVSAPPSFASSQEHISRLGDVSFWWPYIAEILKRHDLVDAGREPVAGFGITSSPLST